MSLSVFVYWHSLFLYSLFSFRIFFYENDISYVLFQKTSTTPKTTYCREYKRTDKSVPEYVEMVYLIVTVRKRTIQRVPVLSRSSVHVRSYTSRKQKKHRVSSKTKHLVEFLYTLFVYVFWTSTRKRKRRTKTDTRRSITETVHVRFL